MDIRSAIARLKTRKIESPVALSRATGFDNPTVKSDKGTSYVQLNDPAMSGYHTMYAQDNGTEYIGSITYAGARSDEEGYQAHVIDTDTWDADDFKYFSTLEDAVAYMNDRGFDFDLETISEFKNACSEYTGKSFESSNLGAGRSSDGSSWGVFHSDTGKCVLSDVPQDEAEEYAKSKGSKYYADKMTDNDMSFESRRKKTEAEDSEGKDVDRMTAILAVGDYIQSSLPNSDIVQGRLQTTLKLRGNIGVQFDDSYSALNVLSDDDLAELYDFARSNGMPSIDGTPVPPPESAPSAMPPAADDLEVDAMSVSEALRVLTKRPVTEMPGMRGFADHNNGIEEYVKAAIKKGGAGTNIAAVIDYAIYHTCIALFTPEMIAAVEGVDVSQLTDEQLETINKYSESIGSELRSTVSALVGNFDREFSQGS